MRKKTTLNGPVTPAELKAWRKEKVLTQQQAATLLAVSLKAYQNWEQGLRDAHQSGSLRKLMKTARPRKAS